MNPFIRNLVGRIHTTIAQNTARHVQLYVRANIPLLERPAIFFVTGRCFTMIEGKVLQITLTGLITDRAVERVVD